jgi:acyl-CoA thioesterase FadM
LKEQDLETLNFPVLIFFEGANIEEYLLSKKMIWFVVIFFFLMARITLQFPDKVNFTTSIAVRITDINYGGHLGNDKVLTLMHEVRMLWLQSINYSELYIEGAGLIMADAGIQFKSEAFFGEVLTAEIAVADISRVGFDLYYRFTCNERVVAIGKTGMLFFDYEKRKIVSCPTAFIEKVNSGQL